MFGTASVRHTRHLLVAFAVVAATSCKKDDPEPTGVVKNECSAYEFQGETYDCTALDPCAPDAVTAHIACCDCDPGDVVACADPVTTECNGTTTNPTEPADSCMGCHNGSEQNDYAGDGLTNPHPFGAAPYIRCTGCHGGDGTAVGKDASHTPAPPEIGDRLFQINNPEAEFNRRTLTGIDKYPDYTVNGVTYSGIDYLQFINPGDLRVVAEGRSCGMNGCHSGEHADWVQTLPLATLTGFYSVPQYSMGVTNKIPDHRDLYGDTAAEYAFRAIDDPTWVLDPLETGRVGELIEYPEHAVYGDFTGIYNNPLYDSTFLPNYVYAAAEDPQRTNQVKDNSPLEHIMQQAVSFQCGDCHLGSAGANNRYADFRSSGCTACHMEYSFDGRSKSSDPNVNKLEPANPDAIAAGERAHVIEHQIRNVYKELPSGEIVRGIQDKACVGCHQGSNRTVLQYWGIRLDQDQDVVNGFQYPANPVTFQTAAGDDRLYDPGVANNTFNGRNANQHLVFEDYDGDARDDTPADIHYERGLGCIDCHGSRDVHNGTSGDPNSGMIWSREGQVVSIACENCHGTVSDYAPTTNCETYDGQTATCPTDTRGNALRNVEVDVNGDYWLTSRVDGARHYVPQILDTIAQTGRVHPITATSLYSPLASYAMGVADGSNANGVGPIQDDPTKYTQGFSHTDDMDCVSCHASWSNACVGCHLAVEYNDDPQQYFFSNTTGERVVTRVTNADFTYQSPVLFSMGINVKDKISAGQPGVMKVFLRYTDYNGVLSNVFAFSDRAGNGNNPNQAGRGAFGALGHNSVMAHSVRGKVTNQNEGPRYCVACHLTDNSIATFGAGYAQFRTDIENRNYANLDYNLLRTHIGSNPGNQLDSPYFVHQAAGLGTGLFQFDANGCPNNPFDANDNQQFCNGVSPADRFNVNNTVYDLDKVVELGGTSNASSNQPVLDGFAQLRAGSLNPEVAGPYGANLLQKLTDPNTGLILDSWLDANGAAQGNAANFIQ